MWKNRVMLKSKINGDKRPQLIKKLKKQIDDLTQTVNSQVAQNDALKSELSIMNERISQIANRSESRVVAQPTNTNPPNLGE